jgi:hypothetical protein
MTLEIPFHIILTTEKAPERQELHAPHITESRI